MTTDHSDLIKRLQEGDGPDRELDYAIVSRLQPGCWTYDTETGRTAVNRHGTALIPQWERCEPPSLTDSRDACAALQAECLPGWLWEKHWNGREHSTVLLPGPDWPEYTLPRIGIHPTSEPRAHLIAILRAKGVQHD